MATRWPTPEACAAIWRDVGLDERVVQHVRAVAALAVEVADAIGRQGHPVDRDLVRAGALLHDVGRRRTHGLDHASVGARMLNARGVPGPVCLIVERHTGGGIDAQEARRLGLPVKDYTPVSLEEKVVCQADNLVDGSKRQRIEAEYAWLRSQGLPDVAAKVRALHEELSSLAGRDLDAFVETS